jgi:hypothetical protein
MVVHPQGFVAGGEYCVWKVVPPSTGIPLPGVGAMGVAARRHAK